MGLWVISLTTCEYAQVLFILFIKASYDVAWHTGQIITISLICDFWLCFNIRSVLKKHRILYLHNCPDSVMQVKEQVIFLFSVLIYFCLIKIMFIYN